MSIRPHRDGRDGSSKTGRKSPTSKKSTTPRHITRSGDDTREPSRPRRLSVRGDEARIEGNRHRRSEALDREPEDTESNPSAAQEPLRKGASTSRSLTDGAPRFGSADAAADESTSTRGYDAPSDDDTPVVEHLRYGLVDTSEEVDETDESADVEESESAEETGESDFRGDEVRRFGRRPSTDSNSPSFVDDPLHQEEDADGLEPPPGLAAGAPIPAVPNLDEGERVPGSDAAPGIVTSENGTPVAGVRESIEVDGVVYERSTYAAGGTRVEYERDGVSYTSVVNADGVRTDTVTSDVEDGTSHNRRVSYDANGELITDTSTSETVGLPSPARQARTVTINGDGTLAVDETVTRPDGGTSTHNVTTHADGRVDDVYNFRGQQGDFSRTTNTAADGSSTTATGRSYETDTPIEQLVGGPEVPSAVTFGLPDAHYLPEGQRDPTSVTELTVTSTNTDNVTTVVSDQTTFAQTSHDVEFVPEGEPFATFPEGVTPNEEASGVTRSVTVGHTLGPNGERIDINEASRTVNVAGTREDGSEVSTTTTDSWNGAGESTSSYDFQGYTRGELTDQVTSVEPRVIVGGRTLPLEYLTDGKLPGEHLRTKGGTEVEEFLGIGEDEVLNSRVDIVRGADGNIDYETVTMSNLDANGNGQTVERTNPAEGPISWAYTDHTDNGRDFERQTVLEGTELSIFESFNGSADGTFSSSSETRNGDEVIATSETSRQIITAEQIRLSAHHGELDPAQAERLLAEGPPYVLDHTESHTEPSEDGQPTTDFSSDSYATGSGFTLGITSNTEIDEESNEGSRESFVTESNPNGVPPSFTGALTRQSRDPETGQFSTVEEGALEIRPNGELVYNGAVIDYGVPLPTPESEQVDVVGYTSSASGGLAGNFQQDRVIPPTGLSKDPLTERINNPALTKVGQFADIISAYGAASTLR